MVSNESLQADLDGFLKNGKADLKLRINGKLFEIPETLIVYTAEIEGERVEDMTENELFSTASSKLEIPSGRLVQLHHNISQSLLVSPNPIPQTIFQKEEHKFIITPKNDTITLTIKNDSHREAIRQIAFSEVKQHLKGLGFVHTRTRWGRYRKEFLIEGGLPINSYQHGAFYYHIFNAIDFRIYWYKDNYLLLILDTKRPVFKSSLSKGNLNDLKETTFNWVSTDEMPKSIRDETLLIRKCNAARRYERALIVLKKIEIKTLSSKEGEIFSIKIPGKNAKYIKEPKFLFEKRSKTLKRNELFASFLLDNLVKYGPFNQKNLPKNIRVKVIRMAQISERYQSKIIKGLSKLQEQFTNMYRMNLEILGPGNILSEKIIALQETEAEVEEYCRNQLREQFKAGEFDLVIGIVYGDEYNHPYRKAIKKGLQDVPSQIIKISKFSSPKIFGDVYKTSISAQIVYKSKGVIPTPISPEFLKDFKIRIYYDIGVKKLPGQGAEQRKTFSILGAIAMIVDNEIYYFQRNAIVNDYALKETTKGELVRQLIREAIMDYINTRNLKAIDGPILLQRDGIYGVDEPGPALDEINLLRSEGYIPPGTIWAFIEFIKDPPIRLFSHIRSMEPNRGTLFILGPDRAFLTTTGIPDIHSQSDDEETAVGVAKTLEIRLVKSSETREDFIGRIAKDVYYRSFLWNAAFAKTRYPVEANMVHELLDLCRQGVTELPRWIC